MKLSQIYRSIVLETVPDNDADHEEALEKTGYWGSAGAGALIIALDTGRILMPLRSQAVEQPSTWGTWGGAIDQGEDPASSAMREVHEESGHSGQIKMIPLNVFEDGDFKYFNFIALVPSEYEPRLNWETSRADWVTLDNLPNPMHFGMEFIMSDQQAVAKIKKAISYSR